MRKVEGLLPEGGGVYPVRGESHRGDLKPELLGGGFESGTDSSGGEFDKGVIGDYLYNLFYNAFDASSENWQESFFEFGILVDGFAYF